METSEVRKEGAIAVWENMPEDRHPLAASRMTYDVFKVRRTRCAFDRDTLMHEKPFAKVPEEIRTECAK
ncbi:unnamed protein product [Bathycoccus prasinos]